MEPVRSYIWSPASSAFTLPPWQPDPPAHQGEVYPGPIFSSIVEFDNKSRITSKYHKDVKSPLNGPPWSP
jgi:hypothetical protein